jgi:hypothetical protein
MADALLPIWGIIVIGYIIALLDWLGRRRDRQSKQRSRT